VHLRYPLRHRERWRSTNLAGLAALFPGKPAKRGAHSGRPDVDAALLSRESRRASRSPRAARRSSTASCASLARSESSSLGVALPSFGVATSVSPLPLTPRAALSRWRVEQSAARRLRAPRRSSLGAPLRL
jgi:hypothetical protein